MSALRLSILDQSPIGEGSNAAAALRDSVCLARRAEELGYHRYWVAEHHRSQSFAGSAPEILAATILQATDEIRVGTGAVLLPLYPTWKVLEQFQVLAALQPGRVDLGVGRAALNGATYAQQLGELHKALDETDLDVEFWVMGAGSKSAPLAASVGASYAHAHFFDPRSGPAAFTTFRDQARRTTGEAASTALAVRVVTAATAAQANARAQSIIHWRRLKDHGIDTKIPVTSEGATNTTIENDARFIVGTVDAVAGRLAALAEDNAVDELIINTPLASCAERADIMERLACAVGVRS